MTAAAKAPRQELELAIVDAARWREAVGDELGAGGRFCGAHASGEGEARQWSALFANGTRTRVLRAAVPDGEIETIVDLAAGAQWDEREAHDLRGLGFAGHKPLRALVEHREPTASWAVPVEGRGVHQVAVGPVHAGVIESGHFRFHVVGERILQLDPKLFYKHRGLERAAEGREPSDGIAYSQRACGACAVANSVAYAQACEGALGLLPSRQLRRARTLLLELERLYNHLNDIGAVCAGVGFATGNAAFVALKERALRLNLELGGHRYLFGTVAVGESRLVLSPGKADAAKQSLRELRADAARVWREVRFAASVQARLDDVGILDHGAATRLGAVGPAARASGIRHDARGDSAGLWYGSSFAAVAPPTPSGDVSARVQMRALELEVGFELLDELLAEPVAPDLASPAAPAADIGAARVESPRGESLCVVEREGSRLRRLRLRTGSYANWPALAEASAGNLLPDFPLINKSFELCYACVDR